jgi:DNA-binding NarL/FixJ family response regulator
LLTLVLCIDDSRVGAGATRVAVVDDDRRFRDAVAAVLAADGRFDLVGEVDTAAAAGDLVRGTLPDCVLVDVRLPGGGALATREVLAAAAEVGLRPAVVAVSAGVGFDAVREMLEAGVCGYLVKGGIGDVLTDLLDRCARGEVVLAVPGAAEALAHLRRRTVADPHGAADGTGRAAG